MPAVAIAPAAADEALVAAAVAPLDAAEVDSECPAWPPSSLSVLLLHSALKPEVEFLHESPRVSLDPVAKLTAAHC